MAQVYRDIYRPHVYEDCILNSAAQHKLENALRAFRDDRRGGVLLVFAFFVLAAAGLAALTIDGSYLYSLKSKIQATADSAALSGAAELPDTLEETPDPDAMRTEAVRMAGVNMPATEHGTALNGGDVTTGNWDVDTRVFTPNGNPINAILVKTPSTEPAGSFYLHLGSLNGEFQAVRERQRLRDLYQGQLQVLPIRVVSAQIARAGRRPETWYRLLAGPVSGAAQANEVCRRMRRQNKNAACRVTDRKNGY